jgi:hypothetical protein
MFRQATVPGLPTSDRELSRAFRESRRALERELADYSSDADRNDLQVLVDASITSAAREVERILDRQAEGRMFRVG